MLRGELTLPIWSYFGAAYVPPKGPRSTSCACQRVPMRSSCCAVPFSFFGTDFGETEGSPTPFDVNRPYKAAGPGAGDPNENGHPSGKLGGRIVSEISVT
ncbi:hypothetical protein AEM38_14660 [Hyphomonadaceae bacterium UKL13-1]|nr:hypothetical protein AEM38_14660 [Hyphomonadaceae bacterium UKL13-1]